MVAIVRKTSRGRWGALVLLAQLLAFGILPTLHLQFPGLHGHDRLPTGITVDSGSAPQHEHRHDESTCQYCRLADGRFTAGPLATVVPPAGDTAHDAVVPAPSWHGFRAVETVHGPRAPPAA